MINPVRLNAHRGLTRYNLQCRQKLVENQVLIQYRSIKTKVTNTSKPNDQQSPKNKKPSNNGKNKPNKKSVPNSLNNTRGIMSEFLKTVKAKEDIKLQNILRQEAKKFEMKLPNPNKGFISFADRLTPTSIKSSLGVSEEDFEKLVRVINFDSRCEDVVIQLIKERVYFIVLVETFIKSFPEGVDIKNAQEMLGLEKIHSSKEFKHVIEQVKPENYPAYFHKSSKEIIDVGVLKRSMEVTWVDRLKHRGRKLLGTRERL